MRRFLAAALFTFLCGALVFFSSFWVNRSFSRWESLLAQTRLSAAAQDLPLTERLALELEDSFSDAQPFLTLLFRKDLLVNTQEQMRSILVYNTEDSSEDLFNAICQTKLQLEQLRRLFFGLF